MTGVVEEPKRSRAGLFNSLAYAIAVFGLLLVIAPALLILFKGLENLADVPILFMALFFTGAGEAILVVGVLAVTILARQDWSKKLLYAIIPLVVVMIVWTSLGHTQKLYKSTIDLSSDIFTQEIADEVQYVSILPVQLNYEVMSLGQGWENLGGRFRIMGKAIMNTRIFGHGYCKPISGMGRM